jgi:hypothetical protein
LRPEKRLGLWTPTPLTRNGRPSAYLVDVYEDKEILPFVAELIFSETGKAE